MRTGFALAILMLSGLVTTEVVAAPVAEPKRGWATPPYVFKTRAEMERVKESLDAPQSQR